jgi:tetratricopeptide (TPR) repeat protein
MAFREQSGACAHVVLLSLLLLLHACASAPPRDEPPRVELPPAEPALPAERHLLHMQQLAAERARSPQPSEENFIWMGRRLAYLGRFDDAIAEFTEGLHHYPDSYKLLRHRGHRWITLRRFDLAASDLSRAATLIEGVPDEAEPDGLPNRLGIPTSTSHTNIYYHLGLAHYLRGEFGDALSAYERCMRFAANDDMRAATAYWLYLTQRRLGRDDDAAATLAPIHPEMRIIENTAYHALLLLYKGERSLGDLTGASGGDDGAGGLPPGVNDATLGYGIGMWHLLRGDRDGAVTVLRQVVSATPPAAFGHIAAEIELRPLGARGREQE